MSEVERIQSKENKQNIVKKIENISKKYPLDKIMDRNMKNASQEINSCAKEKSYLLTATGEPYQLVRIHFTVHQKNKVLARFSQLNCLVYERSKNQWKWLYNNESRRLNFKRSYSSLPKKMRPVILGTFCFEPDRNKMHLNVTSFDRAANGIIFFDRHIRRSYAQVTDVEVVNKLFEASKSELPHHDDYFDIQKIEKTLPEVLINRLSMIASSIDENKVRSELSFSYLERMAKEPLAEIERFPAYYYEDGVEKIQTSLRIRQFIALQHWYGRKDYTFYDLSHEIMYR